MSKKVPIGGMSLCVMSILFFTLAHVPLAGQEKKPAKELKYMEVDLGGGVKMKLVYIEPGKFMMGSPNGEEGRKVAPQIGGGKVDTELQHQVEITKGFYMGVFEVTQQEYEEIIGDIPSKFRGRRLPVETVSWQDAMEFCKKLSKKEAKTFDLPTEAEWEYACRAGSAEAFHYGKSLSSKQGNFDGESPYGGADKGINLKKPAKVGSYEPNSNGLYDMHGNVSEWCKEYYDSNYYKRSPLQDPQGPTDGVQAFVGKFGARFFGHVVRGGSWRSPGSLCRAAARYPHELESFEGEATERIGFRVVLRIP